MKSICHKRYQYEREDFWGWIKTGWKKIVAGGTMAATLGEWLLTPQDTEQHCLLGAKLFYQGVKGFGGNNFGASLNPKWCRLPCAYRMANPRVVHSD